MPVIMGARHKPRLHILPRCNQVVDTVGSGDAFLAAILLELLGGTPAEQALQVRAHFYQSRFGHFTHSLTHLLAHSLSHCLTISLPHSTDHRLSDSLALFLTGPNFQAACRLGACVAFKPGAT